MKRFFKIRLLPHVTWFILKLLWWSWKIILVEPRELEECLEKKKPFLLAHWHGDEVPLLHLVTRYRLATMTSTSEDGEMMTQIIAKLGGVSSRGSSTRGGVSALKGLIRLLKSGLHNASVAVDGPKGPVYKVKPGIFELSKLTQTPIFWAGVSANKYFQFKKAWNNAILPKPFATVYIHWHGPLLPIASIQDPKSSQLAEDLEQKLNAAKHQAQKYFDGTP